MTSPGTDTLERPDVETDDDRAPDDAGDNVFHYVKKDKIAESAVMGSMVQALCGEIFPVTRSPKPGSPVCSRCQEIYEAMKD